MLCDRNESTPAYLERLREVPGLGVMAETCLKLLCEEERMEQAWKASITQAEFPLTGEEVRMIQTLGTVLGRYDIAQQRQSLQYAGRQITAWIDSVREERGRLARMWPVLGISAGALAVILLY